MLRNFFFSFAVLLAILSSCAVAQTSLSGAVAGSAFDAHRAAVAGAQITLTNNETGARVTSLTDASGTFRFAELRPGDYSLKGEAHDFEQFVMAHATVEVGRTTEVKIAFTVAGAREVVEVRDEAPAVNTTQPAFSSNFNVEAIDNLPINERRWSNFALLTPTATLDGDFGLISFRGISGLLNNSTVDGADNNQAFFSEERGRTRISYVISQSAVQEFQVNTSNYSAQYGRAAGAVVNAVTRSGGNRTHGQIFYFDRDNALGAANAFTVVPVLESDGEWGMEKAKPLDRRQQFGATLSGPIVKDKLFYFASFDGQQRDYPGIAAAADITSLFAPPCVIQSHYGSMSAANQAQVRVCSYDELYTLTRNVMPQYSTDSQAIQAFQSGINYLAGLLGPVPRTADHDVAFSKIDYHLTPHNLLGVSYNRMRWSSPGGAQSEPSVNLGKDSFGFDGVKVDTLIARLTSILGRHISNELRYSWSRDFDYQVPQPAANGEPIGPNGLAPAVGVLSESSGFTFGTPTSQPRRALPDEYRNEAADTLGWMHGRQFFKFGFDLNRVHDEMNNLYAVAGGYNYDYRDNFIADLYQWQNQTGTEYRGYSSFDQGFGTPAFAFNTWDVAFFAQNDMRLARRFTLNVGLRYEFELLPHPQIPNPLLTESQSFHNDWNNLGPRVGFAWELTGDGKTALRGGYGIYYGRISNSTISSAITNTGIATAQRSYSYRACYMFATDCLNGPIFPNISPADPYSATSEGNVAVFASNIQTPQIHQADLILERQVAHDTVVSASYLLSLGRELPNFIDINLDPTSQTQVTYTFASDNYTGVPGPYLGHTLTVPVYTSRLNSNFERITEIRSNVNSSYNALVLQLNRNSSRGIGFKLNYTWSHALDFDQNSTTFTTYNNTLSAIPFTYYFDGVAHRVSRPDYGNSAYDIRQRLTASVHWAPRFFRKSHGVLHQTLDHWSLAPIVQIATGKPFSDHVSGDAPGDTCEGCLGFMGTGGQDRLPSLERDSFRYDNLYNVDLRLSRRINFGEQKNLEVLAEAFNLLNHQIITSREDTLYTVYNSTLEYDSNFGTPTAAANTIYRERQLQLGARYHF